MIGQKIEGCDDGTIDHIFGNDSGSNNICNYLNNDNSIDSMLDINNTKG